MQAFILNSVLLDEKLASKIEEELNSVNVSLFYNLATSFKFSVNIKYKIECYIERHFSVVSQTESFSQLYVCLVTKILSSSKLNIDCELEVVEAAVQWVNYDYEERRKHAKDLLLTVRLPLLSGRAFIYALKQFSLLGYEGRMLKKSIMKNKKDFYQNKSSEYFTNRYCSQKYFDILVYGGLTPNGLVSNINEINGKCLGDFELSKPIAKERYFLDAVYLRNSIYFFVGSKWCKGNFIESIEKYSIANNTFEESISINEHYWQNGCICSFIDKLYIFRSGSSGPGSIKIDPADCSKKKLARCNPYERYFPAHSVFNGNIVLSGGAYRNYPEPVPTNTVRSYDHMADKWSNLPGMINSRHKHGSVAVGNKLFMIGGSDTQSNEVFDSTSEKFTLLTSKYISLDDLAGAFSIEKKIVVVINESSEYLSYDTETDEWSDEPCRGANDQHVFCCVKVPQL